MVDKSSPEAEPRHEIDWHDTYPTPEDWVAIQGGKPRVFMNPTRPDTRWIVVHVYEEHDDPRNRFADGRIVETMPPEGQFQLTRLTVKRPGYDPNGGEELVEVTRDVRIPSFMYSRHHGQPCTERSYRAGMDESYKRLKSQDRYEEYIQSLIDAGFQELRFGFAEGNRGFAMKPLKMIKPPAPLDPEIE